MAHYAEAFAVIPGRCFRFVHSGVGHASHCREPVVRWGEFVDRKGRRHAVETCLEHGDEISSRKPVDLD